MTEKLEKISLTNLNQLEKNLSQVLQPVKPDIEFINTLKTKLVQIPTIMVESTKKGSKILLVSLGVFVGIIIVWLLGNPKRKKRNR